MPAEKSKYNHFIDNHVSDEIILSILVFLTPEDIVSASATCKLFFRLCQDQWLWEQKYQQYLAYFGSPKQDTWLKSFKAKYKNANRSLTKRQAKMHSYIIENDLKSLMKLEPTQQDIVKIETPGFPLLAKGNQKVTTYLFKRMLIPFENPKDTGSGTISKIFTGFFQEPSTYNYHPNKQDFYGRKLIHWASLYGKHKFLEQLLTVSNVSVNDEDHAGFTPLHYATWAGHVECVKILLTHGALDNHVDRQNFKTPLHCAIEHGYTEMVDLYLQPVQSLARWESPNIEPLIYTAAQYGRLELLQSLLTKSPNVNATSSLKQRTALYIATVNKHVDVVKELLTHNPNLNHFIIDGHGMTVAHVAIKRGLKEILELFIQQNLFINIVDANRLTLLHTASIHGQTEIAVYLLTNNANKDAQDDKGKTPLHHAVLEGHIEMVKLLLSHQANIQLTTQDGWTALHCAALKGHVRITELLLAHQADIHARTAIGNTALHLAAQNDHVEIVWGLLAHGADPLIKNVAGFTSAEMAASTFKDELSLREAKVNRLNGPEFIKNTFFNYELSRSLSRGVICPVLDKVDDIIFKGKHTQLTATERHALQTEYPELYKNLSRKRYF